MRFPTCLVRPAALCPSVLRFVRALLCLCTLVAVLPHAGAVTLDDPGYGALLLRAADGRALEAAPLVDTTVSMTVTGLIARARVTQTFTHVGDDWVNGIYAFPLPERAAVDRLVMTIGERRVEGRIAPREQARASYERAREQGHKASLVEQQRPNLFTTSVANIGPGEEVMVTIEYQQTVSVDGDWFSLRFPLTIGIRYIPGIPVIEGFGGGGWARDTDQVPDASRITPPVTAPGQGHDNPVSIDVTLESGLELAAIESPWHAITSAPRGGGVYDVTLAAGPVPADRDFELRWRPRPAAMPRAAFFTEDAADAGYGLLMLYPPEAARARELALPREVVYVIDTSGSMLGDSIAQARAALLYAIDRLRAGDTFNLVEFNSRVSRFRPQATAVSDANRAAAREWVRGLGADGGTEMAAALDAVLDGREHAERLRQVVFLTDGSVGNEAALLAAIERRLGGSRLFTVGIGSAPNSYFMRAAAQAGRGSFTYIGAVAEVGERMRALIDKLEFPVLANLRLVDAPAGVEAWPQPIGDLYAGEPLMLSMRFAERPAALDIAGDLAGRPWSTRVPLSGGGEARGLAVAWAREKIAGLEQGRVRGVPAATVEAEVTAL
ncbi:MAG: marine proteobacterial sortase target protein, partial [Gammaproteobacteria bacterium]